VIVVETPWDPTSMSRGDVFRPLVIWLGGNALSFSSFPEKTQSVAPQVFLIPVCVFNPANRSARRPARAPAGKRNFTNRVLAKLRHCDLAFACFSSQGDYANHLRLLEVGGGGGAPALPRLVGCSCNSHCGSGSGVASFIYNKAVISR
jgi:hypothetical protein